MGEHRKNLNAIAKAAMPAGAGHLRVELGITHRLKERFVVVPAEDLRVVDGKQEVRMRMDPETWEPLPDGKEALTEGTQVGIEAMDVVVGLVAMAVSGVTGVDGRPVGRTRWLRDLHREDARSFIAGLEPQQSGASS